MPPATAADEVDQQTLLLVADNAGISDLSVTLGNETSIATLTDGTVTGIATVCHVLAASTPQGQPLLGDSSPAHQAEVHEWTTFRHAHLSPLTDQGLQTVCVVGLAVHDHHTKHSSIGAWLLAPMWLVTTYPWPTWCYTLPSTQPWCVMLFNNTCSSSSHTPLPPPARLPSCTDPTFLQPAPLVGVYCTHCRHQCTMPTAASPAAVFCGSTSAGGYDSWGTGQLMVYWSTLTNAHWSTLLDNGRPHLQPHRQALQPAKGEAKVLHWQ